jgi:hypothetical protein
LLPLIFLCPRQRDANDQAERPLVRQATMWGVWHKGQMKNADLPAARRVS